MICRQCKTAIKKDAHVFVPKGGFWPDGSVKRCYCPACAAKHHWKVNYKAVYKEGPEGKA
jgi:hypothetical protein